MLRGGGRRLAEVRVRGRDESVEQFAAAEEEEIAGGLDLAQEVDL